MDVTRFARFKPVHTLFIESEGGNETPVTPLNETKEDW
jgi:hypothetical protein